MRLGRTTVSLCLSVAVVLSLRSRTSSSQQELTIMDWSREGNGNFRPKRALYSPWGAFLGRQKMADSLHRKTREKDANNSTQCHLDTLFFHMYIKVPMPSLASRLTLSIQMPKTWLPCHFPILAEPRSHHFSPLKLFYLFRGRCGLSPLQEKVFYTTPPNSHPLL